MSDLENYTDIGKEVTARNLEFKEVNTLYLIPTQPHGYRFAYTRDSSEGCYLERLKESLRFRMSLGDGEE